MNNSVSKKENIPTSKKKVKPRNKKRSFLFWILKLLILAVILLFFLWKFSNGGGFWNFKDGSTQETFQQAPQVEPTTSPSTTSEEFLILSITEDKIYLDKTLISLDNLKTSLSEIPVSQKIKLRDDKALYRIFNEVKLLLDDGHFIYIIE